MNNMNKLNIAITGATGYIGIFLLAFLEKQGHTVYSMSRKACHSSDKLIHFELGSMNEYTPLNNIDVLIHCAYDFSITNYQHQRKVNLEGSSELFKQAKSHGVKQIIYISSTSAFETTRSNYGKIKYELEQHAAKYGAITIRPGLVFSNNAKGIVGSIQKIAVKLPIIPIIGKGDQLFFPCHIEDLSALISYLITKNVVSIAPITAASEKSITFKQLILTLASTKRKKPLLLPIPYFILFAGLKLVELMKIPLGLRSDSLKYITHYNQSPDFSILREFGLKFRSFDSCK